MATESPTHDLSQTVQEISERASLLVREEIELAKAEVTEKVTKLIKGAVVGIAAGIFIVFALIYLLHGFAWLTWYEFFPDNQFFWGFFVVAAVLLLLGAPDLKARAAMKPASAPPTPQLAIDEAKLIKETVQSSHPEQTV